MNNPDKNSSALLEWIEHAALEAMKAHLQAADELKRDSTTSLTLFLAGAGAALAYAAKAFEGTPIRIYAWAALALSVTLFALSGAVLYYCLQVGEMPSPTNIPTNLLQENFSLDDLRRVELENFQARINQAVARNDATAYWLNTLRWLAIFSPTVPLILIGLSAAGYAS